MENIVTIIQTLGFPIACVCACAYFIYYIVKRDKDEARDREDKLIKNNETVSDAVKQVAEAVNLSNETNITLLNEVRTEIKDVKSDVDKILDKLE